MTRSVGDPGNRRHTHLESGADQGRVAPVASLLVASLLLLALPAGAAAAPDAYVTNTGDNNLSRYTLGQGGALTAQSPATSTGSGPEGIAVSPDGKNAYVANSTDNPGVDNDGTISQYDIAADGTLTPKDPATVAAGDGPLWIAISPNGAHAYVVNYADDNVSQYSIDAGDIPQGIAISPNGQNVYVVNTTNGATAGSISQYNVGADGTLSPKTPATVSAGSDPQKIVVSPDGDSAYVTEPIGQVLQYDISGTTGALSAKTPPTVSTGPGSFSYGIAITPDGASVYTANAVDDNVSQFSVDGTTGALTPKTPATVGAGDNPIAIAAGPDGRNVYVTNSVDGNISQYDVDADGKLTAKSPATVAAGIFPRGIAIRPDTIAPTATITSGPSDSVADSSASFSFTASEPGSSFQCRLDGGTLEACSSPKAYAGLGDGLHLFEVRATDFSGNTGPVATRTWTIDTSAPVPPEGTGPSDVNAPQLILGGPASQPLGPTVKVGVSADEACQVLGTGKIVVRAGGGGQRASRRAAATLRVPLKPASTSLAAGQKRTLKLKLSKTSLKKVERAMKAPGAKAQAKVKVTAADPAGNVSTARRAIKLRG